MDEENDFPETFGDFLKEEYEKFAIMGIFGTVSVFLIGSYPAESDIITRMGTVASLVIFLMVTGWLFIRSMGGAFSDSDDIDILAKAGFLTISLCTGALCFAILRSIQAQQFSDASSLFVLILSFVISLLLYSEVFPRSRYRLDEQDVAPYGVFVVVFLLAIFGDVLGQLFNNVNADTFARVVATAIFSYSVHMVATESLLGSVRIAEWWENQRFEGVLEELKTRWERGQTNVSIEFSVMLATLSVVAFAFYMLNVNSNITGVGTLWIRGNYWGDWLYYHWLILSSFAIYGIFKDEMMDEKEMVWPQRTLIGFSVSCAVQLLLLWSGHLGTTAISF
ncbi:hypothetical protein [Halogranum rubrum]|uniref:hypothetical protein n=1 Tax=Halogranum rubrum TaxID=553466 RepID=UPI000677D6E9|nr:hypothetical protein [Halogranum salarium]